jgi:hypothetical protein
MAALPKSFNLAEPIPSLPDGAMAQLITCRPISGSSFPAQSIIEVDLGNRGWCDPTSIAIRYKITATSGASSGTAMIGTPVYTPFQRVSTLVGGASIDSISQYNQCAHVLVQGSYDVASKYGLQSQFGYALPSTAVNASNASTYNPSLQWTDGRYLAGGAAATEESFSVSAPLIGTLLSNSEKQLPLFAMPQIRFQFTIDSLANMSAALTGGLGVGSVAMTAFAITNFELVYTMCDMGAAVEKMIYDMGRSLQIKTHGTANSAVAVPSGTSGSQNYVFNQRFASIRSAFALGNMTSNNKWADIVDLTTTNGDYQFLIGNAAFPQAPLSTVLNESGILQETRRAFGNLYEKNSTMSINTVEFSMNVNTSSLSAYEPGKFIVGVNLEKVQSTDHVMMSGASTYNTPISVVVNVGTATTLAANLNLLLDYDAILVLDPVARQLSVRA